MKINYFIWQVVGGIFATLVVGYLSSWQAGLGTGVGIFIATLPWKKILNKNDKKKNNR